MCIRDSSCGVNICQKHVIAGCKCLSKFVQKRLGTGVCMRLEDAPQFVVWCVLGSRQGCSNLGWVMCIIVDNFDTIFRDSLVLESAVGAGTACQTGNRVFAVDAEEICDCDNRQGIHDIVDTRCMQLDLILLLAFDNECVSCLLYTSRCV